MEQYAFLAMVFVAVLTLVATLVVPVFGEGKQNRKRLLRRLKQVENQEGPQYVSLLRKRYLRELSPFERALESLPGMEGLGTTLREADYRMSAYGFVLMVIGLGASVSLLAWVLMPKLPVALGAGLAVVLLPYLKLKSDRAKRLAKFEEQLPDALDVIKRALQAGHPFSETLHLVGTEMRDPIAQEFEATFNDLNYGADLRTAMLGLLERVPSVTVMAFVASVLVQKETGGNLAEILQQITRVIRGRFRFHRKVKTLSAEGRLSAWILVLVPFALTLVISVTTPSYLPVLTGSETGHKLIGAAFVTMLLGIFWIRSIIRIRV